MLGLAQLFGSRFGTDSGQEPKMIQIDRFGIEPATCFEQLPGSRFGTDSGLEPKMVQIDSFGIEPATCFEQLAGSRKGSILAPVHAHGRSNSSLRVRLSAGG